MSAVAKRARRIQRRDNRASWLGHFARQGEADDRAWQLACARSKARYTDDPMAATGLVK